MNPQKPILMKFEVGFLMNKFASVFVGLGFAALCACAAGPDGEAEESVAADEITALPLGGSLRFETFPPSPGVTGRTAIVEIGDGNTSASVTVTVNANGNYLIDANGKKVIVRKANIASLVIMTGSGNDKIVVAAPDMPLSVYIAAGGGDDHIEVDAAGPYVAADGQGGDDFIAGGPAPMSLSGDVGDDKIVAGARSMVMAGPGADHVILRAEAFIGDPPDPADRVESTL